MWLLAVLFSLICFGASALSAYSQYKFYAALFDQVRDKRLEEEKNKRTQIDNK